MAAVTAAAPTLSQIQGWSTEHLQTAATHWAQTAQTWEDAFTRIHREAPYPGGTPWEGEAAEAALLRTGSDRAVVVGAADSLQSAASAARYGAEEIVFARQLALEAVAEARGAGFTVGEDLSVTSQMTGPPALQAARQAQGQLLAAEIRTRAEALVAVDTEVAGKVSSAIAGVNTAQFGSTPVTTPQEKKPQIQAVDNRTWKQDPPTPAPGTPDNPGDSGRHPNYPDHKPNGQWAPANSGVDGDAAMDQTFDDMEKRGIPLIRQQIQVRVTDPATGRTYVRLYDALQPTGTPGQYIGIEHKVNASPITENQQIVDNLVNAGTPARGTLNGQPIEVVRTDLIRVTWPPPAGPPIQGSTGLPGASGQGTVPLPGASAQGTAEVPNATLPGWGTFVSPDQIDDDGGEVDNLLKVIRQFRPTTPPTA
jgi:hypothetical protein